MSYAQLKAFHAVAQEGSIQKASERIHLTQPAVSIQIKRLETDHGKRLFRRSGHTFQLTRDGQLLFETTRRMFRAEEDSKLILSNSNNQFRGNLIVGADGPHVALDIIESFRIKHPDIRIEVVLDNAQVTWRKLIDLEVDVAILAGSPVHPGVSKVSVSRQKPVALMSSDHPLSNKKEVRLETLAEYPVIFRERGSYTQAIIESALVEKKIRIQPVMTLGSREAVVEAVVRGLGTGFIFEREVGQDQRHCSIPIHTINKTNTDELVCLNEQRENPFVDALFRSIKVRDIPGIDRVIPR